MKSIRRPGLHLALGLCTTLVALRAQDAAAPEFVELGGKHFVLRYHGGDELLAAKALEVVEATWAFATAVLGSGDHVPKQPLAVHLYRTVAGYEAADLRLTKGKFQRNLAMSLWESRDSHVALQPPCRDEVLRVLGLPGQSIAMLAWEATHLVRFELYPNFKDHPQWFADGLAAHVAGQVLEQMCSSGSPAAAPFPSTDMVLAQRLLQDHKLPKVADILADRIDDLDFSPRYALRAVFFAFLASNDRQLAKVVDVVRRTGGGKGYHSKVLDAVGKLLGKSADQQFAKYVQALQPQWEEVFRSLTVAGTEYSQLSFADTNAIAWSTEPVHGGLAASGSLRILPGDMQQLNLLFARTDAGFYSIAFTADQGFTVFDFQASDNSWHELGRAAAAGLRLGYASTFQVEAKGTDLVVHLDKLHWQYRLPRPLPADVVWGLGAQRGSAGIWSRIAVDSAK